MVLILLANKLLIKMLIMIFNRFKFYVLTVFLAFVIVGCPYQSEVGIMRMLKSLKKIYWASG